ncbi:MAG: hypothetical protein VX152_08315, partial [Pseudomonadota bacterium]|nr:hypothetical protein [Pseudomonadota bacterium]
EWIGTSGAFPPASKVRLATSVRRILIPDGVDAAFIHDWIQPGETAAAPVTPSVVSRSYGEGSSLAGAGAISTSIY